ncbi:MAG TPA: DUF4926 domain-containing protein [Thermomicrobiales bacterium]|nr:DUF4926 domain-containing protein [Thermomicrobiales bacterium]
MADLYLKPIRLLSHQHQTVGVGAGSVGVVVEDWADGSYEVEFSRPDSGETIAILTLQESEIEPLEGQSRRRTAQTGDD